MPEIVKAAGEGRGFLVVRLAFQGGTGAFLRSFPSLLPVANRPCGVDAAPGLACGRSPRQRREPPPLGPKVKLTGREEVS